MNPASSFAIEPTSSKLTGTQIFHSFCFCVWKPDAVKCKELTRTAQNKRCIFKGFDVLYVLSNCPQFSIINRISLNIAAFAPRHPFVGEGGGGPKGPRRRWAEGAFRPDLSCLDVASINTLCVPNKYKPLDMRGGGGSSKTYALSHPMSP